MAATGRGPASRNRTCGAAASERIHLPAPVMISHEPRTAKLMSMILLLVLAGTALIAQLWATLNNLLSGRVHPVQVLISIPSIILLVLLLRYMARTIKGWEKSGT
jgi:hypothetical protein